MSVFYDQNMFMSATKQTDATPRMYYDLVQEEIDELREGFAKLEAYNSTENQAEVADAIMDSIYVLAGLANTLWGPDKALMMWGEVQRSNMSKVQVIETNHGIEYVVKRREDGKILKPASYFKPDIFGILANIK